MLILYNIRPVTIKQWATFCQKKGHLDEAPLFDYYKYDMEFIDYSDYYYRTQLKEPPPPERSGKFVQMIDAKSGEFIVLSPKGLCSYHADIVRLFCKQKSVDGLYDNEHKFFEIYDKQWSVAGGGKWSIDDGRRTLRLYGYSQAYGRFDDKGLIERLSCINTLSGYDISIDT
ncbi:MAG: hypothetical protein L7F77_13375 [Candidatus Magnetominusculus sp. LBB02]|nr:hypothetical protein [Candidatus Magnetominusculus sp. LBB02]